MEQKISSKSPVDILKYGIYLFLGMVVLGIGVYLYMRRMAAAIKQDVDAIHRVSYEMETEEQIEEKIREIQKYLLQNPQE